jgi:hypothetical protein
MENGGGAMANADVLQMTRMARANIKHNLNLIPYYLLLQRTVQIPGLTERVEPAQQVTSSQVATQTDMHCTKNGKCKKRANRITN